MKRKIMWMVGIGILALALIIGAARYVEVRNRQTDPNWQIAEQICNMESALKEVDESYECQSISKVTPLTYADPQGNTIVYYCCQTTYLSNAPAEFSGLDMNAIGLVIDVSQIENKSDCMVNEYDAFQCEIGERTFLCWTLSAEISCVIEYDAGAISEDSIFRMAESVLT